MVDLSCGEVGVRLEESPLVGVLVGRGGTLVLGLLELVRDGTGSTGDAVGEGVLAGNVALGLLLVGLLGGGGGSTLDGLGDVVGGVLWKGWMLVELERSWLHKAGEGETYGNRVDDLADNALVGCVGVGSRHVDGLVFGGLVDLKVCC